jgi:hypothetical protein
LHKKIAPRTIQKNIRLAIDSLPKMCYNEEAMNKASHGVQMDGNPNTPHHQTGELST